MAICLVRVSAIAIVGCLLGACTVTTTAPTEKSSASSTKQSPSTPKDEVCEAWSGGWDCETPCAPSELCVKRGKAGVPACEPLPAGCDPTMLLDCTRDICGPRTAATSPGHMMCSTCD